MYLKRLPRWARMEAEHSKGHHFPIVASPINISTPVPSSLYVTQRFPSMIAKNQVFSTNFFTLRTLRKYRSQIKIMGFHPSNIRVRVLCSAAGGPARDCCRPPRCVTATPTARTARTRRAAPSCSSRATSPPQPRQTSSRNTTTHTQPQPPCR